MAPAETIATAPANCAGYQTFFSVFLVGSPDDARFQLLAEPLAQQKMPGSTGLHFNLNRQEVVVSVARARANVWVLRAAAHSRMALQPLCAALLAALAEGKLLGYHPLARKNLGVV